MYRFKLLLAGKISLCNYNGQVGEVMAYVSAINKLNTQWATCQKAPSVAVTWGGRCGLMVDLGNNAFVTLVNCQD